MKNAGSIFFVLVFLGLAVVLLPGTAVVSEAAVKEKTLLVGKSFSVSQNGCQYKSSNAKAAFVNPSGKVTAKRAGRTLITVKKGKKAVKKVRVIVKKKAHKPEIGVLPDEVRTECPLAAIHGNTVELSQTVKNNGTSSIQNMQVQCIVTVRTVSGSAVVSGSSVSFKETKEKMMLASKGKIRKGASAKLIGTKKYSLPVIPKEILDIQIEKVNLYSDKSLVSYTPGDGSFWFGWGVKDTQAPVITGIVGKDAYNLHYKDVYRTVYKGEKKSLLRYVSAEDDRDGKVKVTVDTSNIRWQKKGIYLVIYKAKDKAGNESRVKTKVAVRRPGDSADRYAASVLKRIVRSGWSDAKKARAIYRYVRRNMRYVYSADSENWEKSAQKARRTHMGNCYRYYSLARLLLTRAGIPNQTVTRYRGHGPHWWNYVLLPKGWYHFDTTPRRIRGNFCLRTDAQLTAYSKRAGNSHIWNHSWIPASGSKL